MLFLWLQLCSTTLNWEWWYLHQFFFSIVLAVLTDMCVCSHMKMKIVFSKICEELCWHVDRDYIRSVDCFWLDAVFTILILPMHEHERSFHFLTSSISFKVFKFLSYKSFTFFVRFTLRYFMFFEVLWKAFFFFFLNL